jgi:hypothetical protein
MKARATIGARHNVTGAFCFDRFPTPTSRHPSPKSEGVLRLKC